MWNLLLQFMKESGPKPDQQSFCAMLHVCGSTGKAADAQRILSEMWTAGIKPDIKAFCGVLDACAKAKDVESAWEVLQRMPSHGVAPNVVAYTCVMDACVREGSAQSLAQVCSRCLHSSASCLLLWLSPLSVNCIISCVGKTLIICYSMAFSSTWVLLTPSREFLVVHYVCDHCFIPKGTGQKPMAWCVAQPACRTTEAVLVLLFYR
jgi:pentatricopeptide repeat protein